MVESLEESLFGFLRLNIVPTLFLLFVLGSIHSSVIDSDFFTREDLPLMARLFSMIINGLPVLAMTMIPITLLVSYFWDDEFNSKSLLFLIAVSIFQSTVFVFMKHENTVNYLLFSSLVTPCIILLARGVESLRDFLERKSFERSLGSYKNMEV